MKWKYTWMPAPPMDWLGEAEQLYRARAKKGRTLVKTGAWFDRYEKTAPCDRYYRIQYLPDGEELDEEQQDLYAGAGWTLVHEKNRRAVFVSEYADAPELYSDPAENLAMLRRLRRFAVDKAITIAILYNLNFIFDILMPGTGRSFYRTLATSTAIPALLALLFLIALLQGLGAFQLTMKIHRLKKGVPIDHHKRENFFGRFRWASSYVCVFLAVCCGLGFFAEWKRAAEQPLPLSSAGQLWFGAEELQPGFRRARDDEMYGGIYLTAGTLSNMSTLFYPVHADTYSIAKNDATGENAVLYVEGFEARNDWLADQLVESLCKHSLFLRDGEEPTVVADDRFDGVYITREPERIYLKDNYVFLITDLEQNWDAVAERVLDKIAEAQEVD